MSWLFGLVILLVFLFLLFKYPKQTLSIAGLLVVCVVILGYVFVILPEQKRTERRNKVTVSVAYNVNYCGLKYPLHVMIANRSDKTVMKVTWSLVVTKPGFSTNLVEYGLGNHYSCDKILKPGETWSLCYMLPSNLNSQNYPLDQLEYKTSTNYVNFEE